MAVVVPGGQRLSHQHLLGRTAPANPTKSVGRVSVKVQVKDKIRGKLELVFRDSPAVLAKSSKPLMLDMLNSAGASLPEFANWEPAQVGNSLAIQGELTVSGLSAIVTTFHRASNAAVLESNVEAKPAVQWQTQLRPYESYRTPYGIFFRYTPFPTATVNIGENIQRSSQIEAEELSTANQSASESFYEIEKLVNELVRLSNQS